MKKVICIVLCMLLAASACAEVCGNQLGFDVLKETYDGENNRVISPLSLSYALAMAAQGAAGETRRQILNALEIDDPAQAVIPQIDALRQANAAFLTGEMIPHEDYEAALRDRFGARWFSGQDATVDGINAWVKDSTDGMIPEMVKELPQGTQLALVNAISMDAKWQVPFMADLNTEGVFHAPDGDADVTFMHASRFASYGERDGAQLIALLYRDSSLEMWIALPPQDGMQSVLEGLCAEGVDYFQFEAESRMVNLSMPKMDVETGGSLTDALKTLGIEIPFGQDADFSGISDMPLYISDVVQKTRVILDEEGTRAAAATAMAMATGAYNPGMIVDFTMDRPFAFVIVDQASGAVCFAGVVANPVGN